MRKEQDCGDPFQFEHLRRYNSILHFVTSRQGGVSRNGQASLNLGFGEEPNQENVLKNRERLSSRMGFSLNQLTLAQQKHTNRVTIVTEKEKGSGSLTNENRIPETDALLTNTPGICLMVMMADCVPLLVYDPVRNVIGAIHAGWRGTVGKIVLNTLESMYRHFGSRPEDLLVGIGPSIGPCCYAVGPDVIGAVRQQFSFADSLLPVVNDRIHFDLQKANRLLLEEGGILPEHIETLSLCTSCHPELFFSHRAQKANTGRMGAGIMLKNA